ncbi:hypothetical protein BDZ91DRAFT_722634 [Kalaharituber pfeilii]|nr:hypothetical protein BDZ91DRAFT_722634 [Kalaharituber pfeilii]
MEHGISVADAERRSTGERAIACWVAVGSPAACSAAIQHSISEIFPSLLAESACLTKDPSSPVTLRLLLITLCTVQTLNGNVITIDSNLFWSHAPLPPVLARCRSERSLPEQASFNNRSPDRKKENYTTRSRS